jgi:hypothetical protein
MHNLKFNSIIIILIIISSCNVSRNKIIKSTANGTNRECENCSYKIIQAKKRIGYIVLDKRIKIDIDEKTGKDLVNELETEIEGEFGLYYNKYFRQYVIYKNYENDTIISVSFLTKKEIRSINLWCCEPHEVGRHFFRKTDTIHPSSFNFKLQNGCTRLLRIYQ